MNDIGEKLTTLRKDRNLSQSQLASLSKITQATLSNIESGNKNPSVETLSMICNALNIPMADFLSGTKSNNPSLSPELENLLNAARRLSNDKLNLLIGVAQAMD